MNIGRYGIRPHIIPEHHSMEYFEYLHNRIVTWQFGRRGGSISLGSFITVCMVANLRAEQDHQDAIRDVELAKQRRLL